MSAAGLSGRAAAIGLLAGLASGMLGIGGGLVIVPLLVLVVGVPLKRAVGTSLIAVVLTSLVGVATECVSQPANLRWVPAAILAAGAILGAQVGMRVLHVTPTPLLRRLLAVALLLAAASMVWRVTVPAIIVQRPPPTPGAMGDTHAMGTVSIVLHAVVGTLAGVVSSLFGIGGGLVAVPALGILHLDWSFQAARATSLAMIVPGSIVGAILHARAGNVDASLARALAPAAVVGAAAGIILADHLPGRPLTAAFALLLAVSAVKLLAPHQPSQA